MRAGERVFDRCRRRWRKIAGWNEIVREAHSVAQNSFLEWRVASSPRVGFLTVNMRLTRVTFKLCFMGE